MAIPDASIGVFKPDLARLRCRRGIEPFIVYASSPLP